MSSLKRTKIKQIREQGEALLGKQVCVKGWVRTVRRQKSFAFVEVNDGSCLASLQVIVNSELLSDDLTTGASVSVVGEVANSPGGKQAIEIKALGLKIVGACDPTDYPLQKKRHSFEFLRSIAHLRPRTNTIGAIARIRNALAFATHRFFQERAFLYLHSPIITSSDCEGAGELFQVTTLDKDKPPKAENGMVDHTQDFFGKMAYLTVSGQLNGEAYASALSDIYTFGPTFRAENSNTSRHLAEFWMIEPEMAFADLNDTISLASDYLKFLFSDLLTYHEEDLALFDQFVSKGQIQKLKALVDSPFEEISYTEAIEILEKCGASFEFPVHWGCDLQSEHERYLCETHFKKPIVVRDFPKQIKSFYMRDNDDGKTVAAMDILVPGVGEIVGGSQREERLQRLEEKMDAKGLSKDHYWWYLELRKYGSVPHAGFGVGFERLVLFATGMENIRDVIPFPRTPGHADF